MKRNIGIVMLVISVLVTGCSPSSQETVAGDTKQLEARIIELEKENAELKSQIEGTVDLEETAIDEDQPAKETMKAETKEINIGDTITRDIVEIVIKNIELSYDVLPKDTSGYYRHYPADSGKVYIHIDTDVKNLQKQNLPCDEIMTVEADYNDGFTYTSMAIVEDSSGFTYANITSIKPLETMGMRFLIDCPQEVEESDHPLFLTFELGNEKFKYTIR